MSHFLKGCYEELTQEEFDGFTEWEIDIRTFANTLKPCDVRKKEIDYILSDYEYAAYIYKQQKELNIIDERKRMPRARRQRGSGYTLPKSRRKPIDNPWQYAYLITGEKKIGKTSFAIEGCEEFVFQFDKPQLAYNIREEVIKTWKDSVKVIKALEEAAESGDFPYERVIIDGVAEWYAMCQAACEKKFAVDHPSDVEWAKGWHWIRDNFNDAVNRLLRLQSSAECGIIFIAHAEWQEVKIRGGGKLDKLVPNLPPKCEETINGKVDGWFCYDYDGEDRTLILKGDQTTGAGHRIDGHFQTKDGDYIKEIPMGNNATEAMEFFIKAFNNDHEHVTLDDYNENNKASTRRRKRSRRKEK